MSDQMMVDITALAHGGAMIGTVTSGPEEHVGKKAFVREVVPGEKIEIEPTAYHKRHLEGRVLRIIEPSADRIAPPCPYFGACGGCDLQHMTIESQRAGKLSMVERTIGAYLKPVSPVAYSLLGSELPAFDYRTRVTLHLNTGGDLGFYRSGTGEVVAIDRCLISTLAVNAGITELLPHAKMLAPFIGAVVIEETAEGAFFTFRSHPETPAPPQHFIDSLRGVFPRFKVIRRDTTVSSSGAKQGESDEEFDALSQFSQINSAGNRLLVDTVGGAIAAGPVIELYAGAGNFSIPLAQRSVQVEAVEVNQALVEAGRRRGEAAGCGDKLRFHLGSAEEFMRTGHRTAPVLLLDPPRSGAKVVCERIRAGDFGAIVYVSCALPTLVRDLKALSERGYGLESVAVIDMFPQTHHVETVSILRLG